MMLFGAFLEALESRGVQRALFIAPPRKRKVPIVRATPEAGGASPPPARADAGRRDSREGGGPRAGPSDAIQEELGRIGAEMVISAVGFAADAWRGFRTRPRAVPPPTRAASPTAATEIGVPGPPDRADENPPAPAARFREIVDPDGRAILIPLEDA